MSKVTLSDLLPLLPEIILIIGAILILMYGVFSSREKARLNEIAMGFSLALILLIFSMTILSWSSGSIESELFDGAFVLDMFSSFVKCLILFSSFFCLLMSVDLFKSEELSNFEYPVLILFSTAGMMMVVSSGNFISLYMGMEIQSLSLYILASIQRESLRSTEAGLKYFVLGALASGMSLYGISLIYGFTGSTNFSAISRLASEFHAPDEASLGLVFGLIFLLAGLAFKISAAPFHMWTPDVYMGAPTPVTFLFATASKITSIAVLIRLTMSVFPVMILQWQQILIFLSLCSMILGSFSAIGQNNIKRLVAYSSIGHAGFILLGLSAGSQAGLIGVLVYMSIYTFMALGIFSCILAMRRGGEAVESINTLSGIAKHEPMFAFLFATLLFSLAGIPPLLGFFAKFYVLLAAVGSHLYGLALVAVLSSVVSAFYYLRIVKIMYFDEANQESFDPISSIIHVILLISGGISLFGFAFPRPFMYIVKTVVLSFL
ncbi:MAG: NADH-quinone oxidoreductase subunit NuoN [Alphaproteobacteria bacterium]|nr:NADH-quinone oxidoreductase subunit NuoN [Alphaproteobacteria bacterium]